MITDLKAQLRSALIANADLVSLVGEDRDGNPKIQMVASYADDYPRVSYFEVTNFDSDFSDDNSFASEVVMQIDVWHKESTSAISGEVDKTMKQLGYTRSSAQDLYEDDTGVHHKALRYRNKFMED